MEGQSYGVQGFGVYGSNNYAASGSFPSDLAIGTYGVGFVGVEGQTQINGGSAVLGTNIASVKNGTYDNAGVEGQGYTGVLGTTNTKGGGTPGYGVLSNGDLGVLGGIYATGTKSFMIDHPLDPAN